MTGAGADTMEQLRVHVNTSDAAARAGVLTLLRQCGIALVAEPDRSAGTVVVAAAGTVDEAMEVCPAACLGGGHRILLVADTFSRSGVLRAVRAGVHTMLRSAHATPAEFATAVRSAHRGDGRMPHEVLVRLLGSTASPPPRARQPRTAVPSTPLTARQTGVLTLMAEGYGNAAIARALCCSEHTVKNVIYDLTARLLVRNRAQAVACAVRKGLI